MGYMDMLTKVFKSNQKTAWTATIGTSARSSISKPHAERDFFAWVNQWSVMVKKPSDLGFSNAGYDLPP